MKKKVIIGGISFIVVMFLIISINNILKRDVNYYTNISDVVISMYRSPDYDKSGISKEDKLYLDKYLSTLTHENHVVDLTEFIDYSKNTSKANSDYVFVEDGVCKIDYNNLDLVNETYKNDSLHETTDKIIVLYCNGKVIYIDNFVFEPDYEITKNNPFYDYAYVGYAEEGSSFLGFYRSLYDFSTVRVKIDVDYDGNIENIDVKPVDFYDYEIIK